MPPDALLAIYLCLMSIAAGLHVDWIKHNPGLAVLIPCVIAAIFAIAHSELRREYRDVLAAFLVGVAVAFLCLWYGSARSPGPTLEFTAVPPQSESRDAQGWVDGQVLDLSETEKHKVILYTHCGRWSLQSPEEPLTSVGGDGTWRGHVQLGDKYGVLLVHQSFRDPPLHSKRLLPVGKGVIAVAEAEGFIPIVPLRGGTETIVGGAPVRTEGRTIRFTAVPPPPAGTDCHIAGRVEGLENSDDYRIVIYVLADHWRLQCPPGGGLATVASDGTWTSSTDSGYRYAALVVHRSYNPAPIREEIPEVSESEGVIGVAKVCIAPGPPAQM